MIFWCCCNVNGKTWESHLKCLHSLLWFDALTMFESKHNCYVALFAESFVIMALPFCFKGDLLHCRNNWPNAKQQIWTLEVIGMLATALSFLPLGLNYTYALRVWWSTIESQKALVFSFWTCRCIQTYIYLLHFVFIEWRVPFYLY